MECPPAQSTKKYSQKSGRKAFLFSFLFCSSPPNPPPVTTTVPPARTPRPPQTTQLPHPHPSIGSPCFLPKIFHLQQNILSNEANTTHANNRMMLSSNQHVSTSSTATHGQHTSPALLQFPKLTHCESMQLAVISSTARFTGFLDISVGELFNLVIVVTDIQRY